MSRTKNAIVGMCSLFFAASFLTCTSDTISSQSETVSTEDTQVSEIIIDNQTYLDCLDDMTDVCTYVDIPEETSCESHGMCIDSCISEGALDNCFSDCDTLYLGIISSEDGGCSCEICLQECNEWCYCSIDVDSQ